MGLRMFKQSTGWETAYEDVVFTAEAVAADPALAHFAKLLLAHISLHDEIEKARRIARRMLVRANARIRYFDMRLDRLMDKVDDEAAYAAERDFKNALWRRLYPNGVNEVTRLGLESECKEADRIFAIIEEPETPANIKKAAKDMPKLVADGRGALKGREDAMAELGRISARQLGWKETANKLRLGTHADLTKYAAENDLGRDFADTFFPAPEPRGEKKDGGETPAPADK